MLSLDNLLSFLLHHCPSYLHLKRRFHFHRWCSKKVSKKVCP